MTIFNNFWDIIINILILVLAGAVLLKSADWFVESASSLAKKLKIPSLIIGLTLVALGTSLPEFTVSLIAAIYNPADASLSIGNIMGSVIVNITLILGLGAVITPLVVSKKLIKRDFFVLMGTLLLFALFILLFNNGLVVCWFEGLILLLLAIGYIVWLCIDSKRDANKIKLENIEFKTEEIQLKPEDDGIKPFTYKTIIFLVLSLVGIALGANYVVESAQFLAVKFAVGVGISESLANSLVGLTIVAVGTSLPELLTTVISAKKGRSDMAIGNVVGSNILNILFIIGLVSIITPLNVMPNMIVDLCVMIFVNVLAFILCLKGKLTKWKGWVLIGTYILYIAYLITVLFI